MRVLNAWVSECRRAAWPSGPTDQVHRSSDLAAWDITMGSTHGQHASEAKISSRLVGVRPADFWIRLGVLCRSGCPGPIAATILGALHDGTCRVMSRRRCLRPTRLARRRVRPGRGCRPRAPPPHAPPPQVRRDPALHRHAVGSNLGFRRHGARVAFRALTRVLILSLSSKETHTPANVPGFTPRAHSHPVPSWLPSRPWGSLPMLLIGARSIARMSAQSRSGG